MFSLAHFLKHGIMGPEFLVNDAQRCPPSDPLGQVGVIRIGHHLEGVQTRVGHLNFGNVFVYKHLVLAATNEGHARGRRDSRGRKLAGHLCEHCVRINGRLLNIEISATGQRVLGLGLFCKFVCK